MKVLRKFFLFFILYSPVLCWAFEAPVEWIPPRACHATLLREIDRSSHSIVAALYLFTINPQDPTSPTLKIAQALINAKNRGVQVKILMDHNINFMNNVIKSTQAISGKNWDAYELLSATQKGKSQT